ncbi:centrosomal protein of 63 kDa isoform X3 [Rhinatrema bivittatum]|uniref:centrosomal protein of 63 kDa isoform X3 n=1 Tax=Rhinatrema bivittatum TaxID=194408 RepID=UPI0011271450|nr:centrosomal protein of 63 kDa isoform X3 [Rhinatrema bivittatum]
MEALLEGLQRRESTGGLLTTCEAELQELMRQIDIMVAHKKLEWESQMQALSSRLELREQELTSVREMLEQRDREVGMLRQQQDALEKVKQSLVREYEQQLGKFQEELSRLKRSYEKLQRKQLKEAREDAKSKGEDRAEVSRLSRKIEEFRQKSLDWEKQRLLYQQQVASLEAQRKAFAEQSELLKEKSWGYQNQVSSRKQRLGQTKLVHQSEIQHPSSQLERAQDTIRDKELEVERLNLRLEDSSVTSQRLVEEQQRTQKQLTHARHLLKVLKEEKEELRSTLQIQEGFLQSSRVQRELIEKELARMKETLNAKELSIRSLESSLQEKWVSEEGQVEMKQTRSQLDINKRIEQSLQIEVSHLEGRMHPTNTQYVQLSKELTETQEELRLLMEQHGSCKTEAKKLREQLVQAERTYSSSLEGMKEVVSQLTQELHQRDISSGCSSDAERQLQAEVERKAMESREDDVPLTDLRESYIKTLNNLEQENQHLLKDLSETQAKLEVVTRAHQDKYECVLQQIQRRLSEIQSAEDRRTQELQQKHEEEMNRLQARLEETIQHYEQEICALKTQQECAAPVMDPICSTTGGLTPDIRNDSTESLYSDTPLGQKSCSLDLDGIEIDFCDIASINDSSSQQGTFLPMCPLSRSPIGSIATRFLKQEELRSHQLLERLDIHIEELKRESQKTLEHFSQPK